jgi:hypothetical protein
MIATGNRTILVTGQTVAFGDKDFEVVNEIVYLGALVTPKNDEQAANRCFCGHLSWHFRQT